MFEIPEGNLPFVRTGQALLVLDLQNDFVSTESILHVDKPADFLDRIAEFVPQFRRAGKIIWVRSEFETYRPVNDGAADGERIITDNELTSDSAATAGFGRRRRIMALYERMLAETGEDGRDGDEDDKDNSEEPYENEAFLTPEPGKRARCVAPMSLGANYHPVVGSSMDLSKDTFSKKSYYSAFKNNTLLQALRGQFVTELFICGALTNIGIYATAMDAAQYGYSITLVEDCIGYRNKERHDEAIRQLVETTGCAVMPSTDIIGEIKAKELAQNREPNGKKAGRGHDRRNLYHMINGLKIGDESSVTSGINIRPPHRPSEESGAQDIQALKTKGKSLNSSDSLESTPATPKEPLREDPPSAKKPENVPSNRVPIKIRARRRSKSNINDKSQTSDLPNPSSSPSDRAKKPLALSTSATLPKSAERLATIPAIDNEDSKNASGEQTGAVSGIKTEGPLDSKVPQTQPTVTNTDKDTKVKESKEPTNLVDMGKDVVAGSDQLSNIKDDSIPICDGDSKIVQNLLPANEACDIFERVRDEVRWKRMSHQGGEVPRLVAVQGEIDEDGGIPIYRHPADESPPLLSFSPSVTLIKSRVERILGHKVNHCLIQFYRNGTDYISEHSDKTLDIVPNSFIANASLGAMRSMTFRTKKPLKEPSKQASNIEEATPRLSSKVSLPHNSLCVLDLRTNAKWLHGIRQDKRRKEDKSQAELAYDGGRISLTFRLIGTFLNRGQTRIWGQGAVAKAKKDAQPVINGETPETGRMLRGFGTENHSSDFVWQESYGEGFNVLHLSNTRNLFLSGQPVADVRAKLSLSLYDLPWTMGVRSPFFTWKESSEDKMAPEVPELYPVCLVDNDLSRAQVQGDVAIILFLHSTYGSPAEAIQVDRARQYTRLLETELLLQSWREVSLKSMQFRKQLSSWETYASEDLFIAGPNISMADLALWPVLRDIVNEWGDGIEGPNLKAYYKRVGELEFVKRALEDGQGKELKEAGESLKREVIKKE